jgi:hypothetical protein
MLINKLSALTATPTAGTKGTNMWTEPPACPGGGAEAMVLASSLQLADGQIKVANDSIKTAGERRQEHVRKVWREYQAACAAAQRKSGWGDFGKMCQVVGIGASIALAGATGGSSLLLTAALIGMSVGAKPVLERLGMNFTLLKVGGVKLTVADAAAIGVACAGGSSDGGFIATAARGTIAGSSAGQAVATEREGHYAAQEMERYANARSFENAADADLRRMQAALVKFREGMDFRGRAMEAAMSIFETKNSALNAVVGRRA